MMRTIDRAAWREQPWKNGRGTTLELVRWRASGDSFASADGDDYDVRVSLAEVTSSGAFSTFPGYRRHTFLVGPAPIQLGDISLIVPGDHIEIPGETAIEATLSAGPTRLLNVLLRAALGVAVGRGHTAHPVRFTFDLGTQLAHASDSPETIDARDCVWIA